MTRTENEIVLNWLIEIEIMPRWNQFLNSNSGLLGRQCWLLIAKIFFNENQIYERHLFPCVKLIYQVFSLIFICKSALSRTKRLERESRAKRLTTDSIENHPIELLVNKKKSSLEKSEKSSHEKRNNVTNRYYHYMIDMTDAIKSEPSFARCTPPNTHFSISMAKTNHQVTRCSVAMLQKWNVAIESFVYMFWFSMRAQNVWWIWLSPLPCHCPCTCTLYRT